MDLQVGSVVLTNGSGMGKYPDSDADPDPGSCQPCTGIRDEKSRIRDPG